MTAVSCGKSSGEIGDGNFFKDEFGDRVKTHSKEDEENGDGSLSL